MSQVKEIKLELKMSDKDLKKIEKYIRSASFSFVQEYFGELIEQVNKKEKSNLKQKFTKAITEKICEVYKVQK